MLKTVELLGGNVWPGRRIEVDEIQGAPIGGKENVWAAILCVAPVAICWLEYFFYELFYVALFWVILPFLLGVLTKRRGLVKYYAFHSAILQIPYMLVRIVTVGITGGDGIIWMTSCLLMIAVPEKAGEMMDASMRVGAVGEAITLVAKIVMTVIAVVLAWSAYRGKYVKVPVLSHLANKAYR